MNYEFISYLIIGAPALDTPIAGRCEWTVQCTSGIVGDPYGFQKSDDIIVECGMAETMDAMLAKIQTACETHVTDTYPNT